MAGHLFHVSGGIDRDHGTVNQESSRTGMTVKNARLPVSLQAGKRPLSINYRHMKKQVLITLTSDSLGRISPIADQLRREGLHITKIYKFGVIAGEADEQTIGLLQKHKEILSLSLENQATTPPGMGVS